MGYMLGVVRVKDKTIAYPAAELGVEQNNRIKVLDCTIRDIGICNDWDFDIPTVNKVMKRFPVPVSITWSVPANLVSLTQMMLAYGVL